MKTTGIVAEYNPFHNGHKYHIEKTRAALKCDCIVVIMSGNITQRGDVAVFDMYKRAETAVQNGVDLVLSIPPQAVLQSAQYYAYNAVYILERLTKIDYLSFGSEIGNMEALENEIALPENFKDSLKTGVTYAKAMSTEVLKSPNNILGVEYLRALKNLDSNIIPYTIKRSKVEHNQNESVDNFASASFIRGLLKENKCISEFVPNTPDECPKFEDNIINLLNYRLILGDEADFENHANISEGLNNRILKYKNEKAIEDIISKIKCKRYTETRIRRALYSILLDIKKDDIIPPTYTRVLAMTETGQKFLNSIRKTKQIEIYSKITRNAVYNNPQLKKELMINEIYKQL